MLTIAMEPEGPTSGYLVWQLATRWRAALHATVSPYGLSHGQYTVLAALVVLHDRGERPSQRRLGEMAGLEPAFTSKIVKGLVGEGWATREPDPDDGRVHRLIPTAHALAVAAEAREAVLALDRRLTSSLPPEEEAAFRRTLTALLERPTEPEMP